MTQPATMDPQALQDLEVIDNEGSKVGKVNVVFVDNTTGRPEWAAVKTGLFGGHVTLVPLSNARVSGDQVIVAYTKDAIKDAPNHDPDVELTTTDEAGLLRYYGLSVDNTPSTATHDTASRESAGQDNSVRDNSVRDNFVRDSAVRDTVGHDTSGPNTDDAMTRSEERMSVGTEQVQTGVARLRKFIVTEQVTQTIPVSHEEIRVVHEPITEANRDDALRGADLSEEEHEVVLHAERPVVTTETVPVERVRLATETVQSEQEVTREVRKEQIEQVSDDVRN
jgi:uncharacterized protein (TIGR02271 family)